MPPARGRREKIVASPRKPVTHRPAAQGGVPRPTRGPGAARQPGAAGARDAGSGVAASALRRRIGATRTGREHGTPGQRLVDDAARRRAADRHHSGHLLAPTARHAGDGGQGPGGSAQITGCCTVAAQIGDGHRVPSALVSSGTTQHGP
jgi:hypothetical protein